MSAQNPKRRALLSVYDKTGVVDFARTLVEEFDFELLSTGGTAKELQAAGLPVTLVEDVTGFGEMLGGRVKTLHPAIHAAILADRDNPNHMRQLEAAGIVPIDLVVVNLYPFEQTIAKPGCTLAEAVEMIDIGGVTLLRAAAKNHKDVLVCFDQESIEACLRCLRNARDTQLDARLKLAIGAYAATYHYDSAIQFGLGSRWLPENQADDEREQAMLSSLRYGENPHQSAKMIVSIPSQAAKLRQWTQEQALELSYNNHLDMDAAASLCAELAREPLKGGTQGRPWPCVVFVKHSNPCGVGLAPDAITAYERAYLGDPNAAMGGVLACSQAVDAAFATAVMETLERWGKSAGAGGFFVEVWTAPRFDDDAVAIIRSRKPWGARVRLLGGLSWTAPPVLQRSTSLGLLMQSPDLVGLNEANWKSVTQRTPTHAEMNDLRLAWLVAKHTRSNSISICKDGMLIGNGAGQMSRVMSCRLATWLAKENGHAEKLAGSVAASDAFFPFRDGPDILIDAGVTAIIQPGGSKRDADTIAACDERGVAMIFTGTRHFRH
jgi:phosphoribosylaminoimidazolecarboxamide formyltransferase/IMP cyclohydrolase